MPVESAFGESPPARCSSDESRSSRRSSVYRPGNAPRRSARHFAALPTRVRATRARGRPDAAPPRSTYRTRPPAPHRTRTSNRARCNRLRRTPAAVLRKARDLHFAEVRVLIEPASEQVAERHPLAVRNATALFHRARDGHLAPGAELRDREDADLIVRGERQILRRRAIRAQARTQLHATRVSERAGHEHLAE